MLAKAACSSTKASSESCLVYGGFSSNLEKSRGAWNSPSALRSLFFPASKKAKMTDATSFLVLSSCQGCNLLREEEGGLNCCPPHLGNFRSDPSGLGTAVLRAG